MDNRIEKKVEIKAPISRVWRALTDYREFGQWFRVKLDGPFVAGKVSRGNMLYPGYEHLAMIVTVEKIAPEKYFSISWHPNAVDPQRDYSSEPETLVEFRLEKTPNGTLLTVTESGFAKILSDRRLEAFRENQKGWAIQMENIKRYVTDNP